MNEDLTTKLAAEHDRHGAEVAESISGLADAAAAHAKALESATPKDDGLDKAVQEFSEKMDTEQATHLEKCMKAVDEAYDLDPLEKTIDSFKKAIEEEHLTHVKCFDKAIDAFKSQAEGGEVEAALDEFKVKAADELDRHEQAQMQLCEKEVAQDEQKAEEPIIEEIPAEPEVEAVEKSGRAISAKNQEKIAAIIKSIEGLYGEHGKTIDTVIAALKELSSSPLGDEGKETEEKSRTPNARSSSSGAAINKDVPMSDLDTYLFTQRLLRQVKSASEDGLRQIKEDLKAKFPSRR